MFFQLLASIFVRKFGICRVSTWTGVVYAILIVTTLLTMMSLFFRVRNRTFDEASRPECVNVTRVRELRQVTFRVAEVSLNFCHV